MGEFEIEDGVPIPGGTERWTGKYGFSDMKPGQSIFVAGETTNGPAAYAARKFGQRKRCKMVTRKVEGGVRIWRDG